MIYFIAPAAFAVVFLCLGLMYRSKIAAIPFFEVLLSGYFTDFDNDPGQIWQNTALIVIYLSCALLSYNKYIKNRWLAGVYLLGAVYTMLQWFTNSQELALGVAWSPAADILEDLYIIVGPVLLMCTAIAITKRPNKSGNISDDSNHRFNNNRSDVRI